MSDATTNRDPLRPAVDEAIPDPARNERLERAAQSAHVLCEALWEALHDELAGRSRRGAVAGVGGAPTPRTAALAERLVDVAESFALLVTRDRDAAVPAGGGLAGAAHASETTSDPAAPEQGAVLVDERYEDGHEAGQGPSGGGSDGREPPAACDALIASALKRFERDRLPFALVLIEAGNAEQPDGGVRLAEVPHLMRQIESASIRALDAIGDRPTASVALERPGRLWLQVPQTDRAGAHALGERLMRVWEEIAASADTGDRTERYFAALTAQRTASATAQGEAELALAVGTAVCPDDGQDAAALVRHASMELAAMRGVGPPDFVLSVPV